MKTSVLGLHDPFLSASSLIIFNHPGARTRILNEINDDLQVEKQTKVPVPSQEYHDPYHPWYIYLPLNGCFFKVFM